MEKSRVKKAVIDQKEEIELLSSRVRLIERSCFEKYKAYAASTQIKVIMGVRRSGKSILAYQLLKDKRFAYINLDDEKLANISADDLNDVLEACYEVYGDFKHLLLDEIQNIPGWELFVNRLQRQGFNIIVTGSNANLLGRELSTHLTGRHIALELFPFSFKEFAIYHGTELKAPDLLSTKERGLMKKKLEEYMFTGGFPEVVREPESKKAYLQSLYSDILNKDIIVRHKIRFSKTFKEIANSLMSNAASHVSFNKLKNSFNLKSAHTASNYMSFLEESFLFFLVPRFSFKAKERAIASRKIYSIDTGIMDTLSVNFSPNIGKIYENMVFLELARRSSMGQSEIYYWQDAYQNEVDFVVKEGREIKELIQVCYDAGNYDTKKREVTALLKSAKELKCGKLTVITNDYEAEEAADGGKVKFVPLWKWLLE
ncbi:ATP-binding protein [Candidatus Woesearchaeota archaeon]|nr:ATP-binding protein [Candidatus Woesearchaeota archaeon]